jgi:DNA-binding protein Fis
MFSPGIDRSNSYCMATANMGNPTHSLMMEFIKRTQERAAQLA